MKSAIQTIIISILVFGFYSCISDIDFERPDEYSDNLVIQGRVVKSDSSFVEVTVTRALNSSPDSRVIIRAEIVTLIDDQGNELLVSEKERGSYFQLLDRDSPVQAVVGRGYRIRVEMPDGQILESSNDVMVSNQAIEKLNLSLVAELVEVNLGMTETQTKVQVSVDTNLSDDNEGGLYWDLESTYKVSDASFLLSGTIQRPSDGVATCNIIDKRIDGEISTQICYITTNTDATRVSVFNFKQNPVKQIRNFELAKIPVTPILVEGYYILVKQYSLSEGGINYWSALDRLVNRTGGVFDSPVGEVPSNLVNINDESNKVFGYFFATEEKSERIRIPDEMSENVIATCQTISNLFQIDCFNDRELSEVILSTCSCLCCDCLAEENSTLVQPSYWVD